jgi:hypothetical protein
MLTPKFDPACPDNRHFKRITPETIRNIVRYGTHWAAQDEARVRENALAGMSIKDCCEAMGRPWSSIASRYVAAGVAFQDLRYRLWQRRYDAPMLEDEPM